MLTDEEKQEVIKQCFELPQNERNIVIMRKLLRKAKADNIIEYEGQEFDICDTLESVIELQEEYDEYNKEAYDLLNETFN